MTKDQLCKAANVSARTIDRDIKDGFPLAATYEKVKGRSVAFYDDEAATKYIAFRQGKVSPGEALAVQKKEEITRQSALADDFLDKFFQTLKEHYPIEKIIAGANLTGKALNGSKMPVVELKDKHILSLREASKLSGIPRQRLIAAYRSGILPGFYNDVRVGRGFRFERTTLEAYTLKLSCRELEGDANADL